MRSTRSATGKRRSHHGLDEVRLALCECGAYHQKHRACANCGKYRGRQVINVVARTERAQKRLKRRETESRALGTDTAPKEGAKQTHDHHDHDHGDHKHDHGEVDGKKETKKVKGKSRKKAGDDAKGA
jgi:large subunit ribosomal protein L32